MSSSKHLCCPDICPDPCAYVCNEPCITTCEDSNAVVYAPPVVVRFPGPILATCPQDSFVGTTLPNFPYRLRGGLGGGLGGGGGGGAGGDYGGGFNGRSGAGGIFRDGYGGRFGGGYGGSYGHWERYGRNCYANRCECCPPW